MSHHVHKVTAFKVTVEDRPGTLQRVTADLREGGAILKALWAWTEEEGQATVMFVPQDAAQVTGCGCATCRSAQPVPVIWLEEADRPGALDDFLQPLAAAEINLQAVQAIATGGNYVAIFSFADEATLDRALAAAGGGCGCDCG